MLFFAGDESGQDRNIAPYEVFAIAAIPSSCVWKFSQRFTSLEQKHFGLSLSEIGVEGKGKTLLAAKKFKQSRDCGLLDEKTRRHLTSRLLLQSFQEKKLGRNYASSKVERAAYAQSCLAFISDLLEAAISCETKAFAVVLPRTAPRGTTKKGYLRKDYRILLSRLSGYLQARKRRGETGLMIFDETERKQSRQLISQFESYFSETSRGYQMTKKIIPTPFFVHSDLTPIIQLADIFAYVINWGFRKGRINDTNCRTELAPFAKKIAKMEFRLREKDDLLNKIWISYGIQFVPSPYDVGHNPSDDKNNADKVILDPAGERQEAKPMPSPQLDLFLDNSSSDLFEK